MREDVLSNRNTKRWRTLIGLVVTIFVAALLFLFLKLFINNQKNAIWTERETTMRDRSEKVATIVSATEDAVWPIVKMEAAIIRSGQIQTVEELTSELNKTVNATMYENAFALAIDADGKYLASDGGAALLDDVDFLLDALEYGSGTALKYTGPRQPDHDLAKNREHGKIQKGEDATARGKYTAAFKAKIVLEVLQGARELEIIAAENNLNPNMVRNWKSESLRTPPACLRSPWLKHSQSQYLFTVLFAEVVLTGGSVYMNGVVQCGSSFPI